MISPLNDFCSWNQTYTTSCCAIFHVSTHSVWPNWRNECHLSFELIAPKITSAIWQVVFSGNLANFSTSGVSWIQSGLYPSLIKSKSVLNYVLCALTLIQQLWIPPYILVIAISAGTKTSFEMNASIHFGFGIIGINKNTLPRTTCVLLVCWSRDTS